ncbi:hypothetical protein C8J56DRAFT_1165484 [Mycena floridula]|nr:hypothetical protein C8J56DRAFT_1165484 [Mycena floridula]
MGMVLVGFTHVAMIKWLALTSAAYKRANEECGVRDREKWDIRGLISVWYYGLPWRVQQWLARRSKNYDDQAFTGAMDQAGHSCHKQTKEWVTWWLFMRSQLFPTQQESIIYLGYHGCRACLSHKPVPRPESPPSWTPSPALVALRKMWDCIDNTSRDFSKWLSDETIDALEKANEFLMSLPRDTDENEYLYWVNTYPLQFRDTVIRYTLAEWQAMDDCIQPSECGGLLNIRSWWAGMLWRMTPRELSHSAHVKWFIRGWRCSDLEMWDSLPPPTPAPDFRDAIRDSGHTCWEEPQIDDYAAAMAFLEEVPNVVGIDVLEYSTCQVCRFQWGFKELGQTLPVEERAFEADMTELLVMLRTECSRRKVAWDDVLMSVQKKFVAGGDSLDSSEESDDGDGGSDDDEASGEDDRAPEALIHPSQINTAGHGENNPSSGLVQNEEVVDVDEESADAVRRPNFTNLLSENPHPYSTGPVNFGEAVIHGRQIHDSQQINALSTNSGGSQGLYAGSDRLFRHMYLDPPSPQHIQNGTPSPWLQNFSGSGSDPMVGQQWEYIEDRTTTPNFHEGLSQLPHLDNGQFKMNSRAVEHSDTNTTLHPISLSNQRESLWQNAGYYATTEPSGVTYPTGSPVRPQIASAVDIEQDVRFTSRNTPPINSQSHASNVAAVGLALPSKRQMADEIKKHLTDEMGKSFLRVGISLAQTDKGQVKLPWLDFETTLGENRVRMINWPAGVARPGKDLSKDTSKGIYGVRLDSLTKIYRAIRDSTAPIQLLREETVSSSGLYTMSEDPETSVSRKRTRDSGDDDHEMSPPERGGKHGAVNYDIFYPKRRAPAAAAADHTSVLTTYDVS